MSALTRPVDSRHPIAGWLFRAVGLPINGTLVLAFEDALGARRAAVALSGFRRKGRLGPPGSFDETLRDPKGEGVGHFDQIVVSQVGAEVRLKHLPDGHSSLRANEINPVEVSILCPEDEGCSHVNTAAMERPAGRNSLEMGWTRW